MKSDSSKDLAAIHQASYQLHVGDSLMWDWMRHYKSVSDLENKMEEDELIKYLLEQKESVGHVNQVIKTAIEMADALLHKSKED